jgi:hypothetical protein
MLKLKSPLLICTLTCINALHFISHMVVVDKLVCWCFLVAASLQNLGSVVCFSWIYGWGGPVPCFTMRFRPLPRHIQWWEEKPH